MYQHTRTCIGICYYVGMYFLERFILNKNDSVIITFV